MPRLPWPMAALAGTTKSRFWPPAIFVALLAPFLAAAYYIDAETRTEREFAWRQRDGLAHSRLLKDVIDLVQKHRGNTSAYLGGDRSFRANMTALAGQIDARMRAVRDSGATAMHDPVIGEYWQAVESRWAALKQDAPMLPPGQSIERHTALVADIRAIVADAADRSSFGRDTDLTGYHAANLLLDITRLTDAMGQARATGVSLAVRGSATARERARFNELLGRIEGHKAGIERRTQVMMASDTRLAAAVQPPFEESRVASSRMIEVSRARIGQQERIGIGAREYLALTTREIDAQYRLFDATAGALQDLLDKRIEGYSRKRALTGLFVLFVLVASALVYAVLLRRQQLLSAALDEAVWRELELRTSEERFELVAHATQDGIWDWDLASGCVYYSARWKTMLGYASHEIGEGFIDWQALIHPDDLGQFLRT